MHSFSMFVPDSCVNMMIIVGYHHRKTSPFRWHVFIIHDAREFGDILTFRLFCVSPRSKKLHQTDGSCMSKGFCRLSRIALNEEKHNNVETLQCLEVTLTCESRVLCVHIVYEEEISPMMKMSAIRYIHARIC